MAYLLLGLAQVIGLLLLPFWTGGIWLQLGSLALYGWWARFEPVGWMPIFVLLAAAVATELAEPPLAGGPLDPTTRRRGGVGGLVGGGAGLAAGFLVPLVGPLFGALLGAVVGAGMGTFGGPAPRARRANAAGSALALAVRATAAISVAAFAAYSFWV